MEKGKLSLSSILKFLIPSIIGFYIFLVPYRLGDRVTITVGHILSFCANALAEGQLSMKIALVAMLLSTVVAVICVIFKIPAVENNEYLRKAFKTTKYTLSLRIVGTLLAYMVYFKLGTEVIYSSDTGGVVLELAANIMIWFIVASVFIPLLFDFGLMDFFGTILSGLTRILFKLPGRGTIDLITSFIGDQNVGIMITNQQYREGFYTGREAAIIATCFSATGIGYWYMLSETAKVATYFVPMIGTIAVTSIIATFIMVRIYPFRNMPDSIFKGAKNANIEKKIDMGKFELGVRLGVTKASKFKGRVSAKRSINLSIDVVCSVLPIVMIIGTLGLVVSTYTEVFNWLSLPFKYYLEALNVPEAIAAAPATIAGFADVMIPSILVSGLKSDFTRFVITALSLIQIIYMSEVGPILLLSDIPINFRKLVEIFIIKTIIALPIIVLMAKIFGIPY